MKFIYIAGPYSASEPLPGMVVDEETNVRIAITHADIVADLGGVPFVPHVVGHHWNMLHPHDYEFWMNFCLAWVSRCDALFRIAGPSAGADREVALMESLGKPVFRNIADLRAWLVG